MQYRIYNEVEIKYVTTIAHNMGWEMRVYYHIILIHMRRKILLEYRITNKLKMNSIKAKLNTKNHKQNKM